jgi:Fe2+ or Zn2+ uptake regulation protein
MKTIFIFNRGEMPDMQLIDPAENWLLRLQKYGYRLTESRRAVVNVIASSEHILTATEVFDLARQRCDGLGLVTVYRTLAKLEELALIERVHLPADCHAYIASFPGHQHLLICQCCGRAEYFGGDQIEPLMEVVARESGYLVSQHWLQLMGLCAECQVSQAEEAK